MILRGLVLFCRPVFSYRLGGRGIRRSRSGPGCRAALHDAIGDPTLDVTAGIEVSTLTLLLSVSAFPVVSSTRSKDFGLSKNAGPIDAM